MKDSEMFRICAAMLILLALISLQSARIADMQHRADYTEKRMEKLEHNFDAVIATVMDEQEDPITIESGNDG